MIKNNCVLDYINYECMLNNLIKLNSNLNK